MILMGPEIDRQEKSKGPNRKRPLGSDSEVLINWSINLDVIESTQNQFHRGSRFGSRNYKLVAWSFAAASIDLLIATAISLFLSASALILTQAKVSQVLAVFELQGQNGLLQFIFVFALALFVLNLIFLRVFLGFTIGEWACGLRLGSLIQRLNKNYSLLVLARVALNLATGIIVLPTLSVIFGKDILGGLCGLRLMQNKK